ncbi:methyl-accepting chemotaxis protein [Pigmentibacter ruber]
MLKKLSIKQKMVFWNILIVIIFTITLVYLGNESIERMMEEKRTQIRNLTDSAANLIYKYVDLTKEGKISKEEAVNAIKIALNAARYDGDNYFFVGDEERRQIINPKRPKDDGVVQNSTQYKMFVEILQSKKQGEFLSYFTTKPGSEGDFPKLTYLRTIPEWNWYVGTGIYIDDVDRQKRKNFIVEGSICIILAVLLTGGGLILANFISIPLTKLTSMLNQSSNDMEQKSQYLTLMSENVGKSSKAQANSIQETAAAIEEVTSMIARTSTLTHNSEELSKTISQQTEEGNQAVNDMVSSMAAIQEASQKLSEIEEIIIQIENKAMVINDIVSKTELLSLNASIESARAGEYGKGFAVVAEEVGNLAKTSGKSSNEIRELLDKSRVNVKNILELTVSRVAEGQSRTQVVSSIFNKIIHDVNEIQTQMTQITEATKEQEIGVKHISEAMSKIDQSAIKNQESADKSIEASKSILILSEDLKDITKKTKNIVFGEKIA